MFSYIMENDEIGTWGANTARPWKRRLQTVAQNADSARFVPVAKEFGATASAVEQINRVEFP
jgi:hypothetical protein